MKECDALTAGGSKDEVQMAEKPASCLPGAPKLLTGLVKQQPLRRMGLETSRPRLLPQSLNDCSINLCLFFCSAYRVIIKGETDHQPRLDA